MGLAQLVGLAGLGPLAEIARLTAMWWLLEAPPVADGLGGFARPSHLTGGTDQAAIGHLGVVEPPHGLEDLESPLSTACMSESGFEVVVEVFDHVFCFVDGSQYIGKSSSDLGSSGHD